MPPLLSDVVLYEDCPSMYATDLSRRHRWIRGDWQIAGWLFPRIGIHIATSFIGAVIDAAIGAIILLVLIRLIRRA